MDAPLLLQSIYQLVEEHTLLFSHQVRQYHDETHELLSRWNDTRATEFQKSHQAGLNEVSYQATDLLKQARLNLQSVSQAIGQGQEHLIAARGMMQSLEEVTNQSTALQQRATDFAERAGMESRNAEYSANDADHIIAALGSPPL